MVALRSRCLGTVWTKMYLNEVPAVADITCFDRYGRTKTQREPGVVDEIDLKAKPDAVRAVTESLDVPFNHWRFDLEQVLGGSRLHLHAALGPGGDSPTVLVEVRRTLDRLAQRLNG